MRRLASTLGMMAKADGHTPAQLLLLSPVGAAGASAKALNSSHSPCNGQQ